MHAIRSIFRYVWAAPASALGLAVALVACVFGARVSFNSGAIEVVGGALARAVALLPRDARFCAITFGHVIIAVSAAVLEDCREHERVHVRQYEKWGVLFFPLYFGSSVIEAVRGRHPYLDNHFERAARSHAASLRTSGRRATVDL